MVKTTLSEWTSVSCMSFFFFLSFFLWTRFSCQGTRLCILLFDTLQKRSRSRVHCEMNITVSQNKLLFPKTRYNIIFDSSRPITKYVKTHRKSKLQSSLYLNKWIKLYISKFRVSIHCAPFLISHIGAWNKFQIVATI